MPAGRDRLTTLKFRESELLAFVEPTYELQRIPALGHVLFFDSDCATFAGCAGVASLQPQAQRGSKDHCEADPGPK